MPYMHYAAPFGLTINLHMITHTVTHTTRPYLGVQGDLQQPTNSQQYSTMSAVNQHCHAKAYKHYFIQSPDCMSLTQVVVDMTQAMHVVHTLGQVTGSAEAGLHSLRGMHLRVRLAVPMTPSTELHMWMHMCRTASCAPQCNAMQSVDSTTGTGTHQQTLSSCCNPVEPKLVDTPGGPCLPASIHHTTAQSQSDMHVSWCGNTHAFISPSHVLNMGVPKNNLVLWRHGT